VHYCLLQYGDTEGYGAAQSQPESQIDIAELEDGNFRDLEYMPGGLELVYG
jgi:hypothetical protein